jgi:hypothetical protein
MSRTARAIGTILQVVVYVVAVAVVSLMVWGGYTVVRRGPAARARIDAAREEAPRLMHALCLRPEVVAVGSRNEVVNERGRRTQIIETQVCDAPGTYTATSDYYLDRLTYDGWRVVERSEHYARLAKGAWDLRVQEGAISELPGPSCRYTLRLTWQS